MGRLPAGAFEKLPRTFAQSVDLFEIVILTSDVGVYVCGRIDLCALTRDQSTAHLDTDGVWGDPLLAPPSSSARVQSHVDLVELGGGMRSLYRG